MRFLTRKKILLLCIGLILIVSVGIFLTRDVEVLNPDLKFSNTMTWNSELLLEAESPSVFTEAQLATIVLPPPPANDSDETQEELRVLHTYLEEFRTKEKLAEIDRERELPTAVFGTDMYGHLASTRPKTAKLIEKTIEFVTPVLMAEKLKYDRVRPSFLDTTLTTTIVIPGHPAYPSGHATESHLFALILGKLNPSDADAYLKSAERIARNREIAGVHYPSDSIAGKLLAAQLYPILFENKDFALLFNSAKVEWESD